MLDFIGLEIHELAQVWGSSMQFLYYPGDPDH